jgi:flagellar biosynthesis protein FlhB
MLGERDIDSQSNKNFFSKRNAIIILLTFLLSIILIVLTLFFILRIRWGELLAQFGQGLSYHLGWF